MAVQEPLPGFPRFTGILVEAFFDPTRAALRLRPHRSNDPTRVHLDWLIAFPYCLRTAAGELYAVERLIPISPALRRPHYQARGRIRRERDGAVFDHRGRPFETPGGDHVHEPNEASLRSSPA